MAANVAIVAEKSAAAFRCCNRFERPLAGKNTLRNAECGMATTGTLRNVGCGKKVRNEV